jgi:hypothetical protein
MTTESSFERFMALAATFAGASVVRPITDAQRALLAQDLPRDEVKTLPGKKDRDGGGIGYVDGHYVIERLNAVFGYDGWAVSYGALVTIDGERPVFHVPATLTAGGVARADIGVGLAATKSPDSLETAIKAAYTDGLKRCARMFGASFGLALYDKDKSSRAVGFSFATQSIVQAFDVATDHAAFKTASTRMRAEWDNFKPDEREAVTAAHGAATKRFGGQTTQSAKSDALAPYRARIAACPTTEVLAATCFEAAPTLLPEQRTEAWSLVVARAVALGSTDEAITKACAANAAITKEPQVWATVATVLKGLHDATTAPALVSVVKTHGPAVSKLPDALKAKLNAARKARLDALTSLAAQLEEQIRRASTIPDLDAVHDKITGAVTAKTLSVDEAKRLVEQYNAAASSLEQEQAA